MAGDDQKDDRNMPIPASVMRADTPPMPPAKPSNTVAEVPAVRAIDYVPYDMERELQKTGKVAVDPRFYSQKDDGSVAPRR